MHPTAWQLQGLKTSLPEAALSRTSNTMAMDDTSNKIIAGVVVAVCFVVIMFAFKVCAQAVLQALINCTPCGLFGIPCPPLGFYSKESIKLRRAKMSNPSALVWSEAGQVEEEKWVNNTSAGPAMCYRCNHNGSIILPWGIDPSPYRLEYPSYAVFNGLFGSTVVRSDRGIGRCMLMRPAKPAHYELYHDEMVRPLLPFGVDGAREFSIGVDANINRV